MEAPTRTTSTRTVAGAVLIVLALGLALRLILAHLLPGSGFANDLIAFRFWANDLAVHGPFGFYGRDFLHDYTPGYMYVLWAVGILQRFLQPLDLGGLASFAPFSLIANGDLIKLPAIFADVALAGLAWSMTRELGGGRRAAVLAAAIVLFLPITWFDSVVWGQVDSVGVVFLLLGIRELWRDRPERSAIFTVIAAVIKPQLGILVPIVAAITIRRALFPVGGYGDEAEPGTIGGPSEGRTTLPWEREVRGPIRILTTGVAGLLTAVLLAAPFGLSIVDLFRQVATAAGGYPYLSVNAYNPWALLELNGSGVAASGTWVCDALVPSVAAGADCPDAFMFGIVPAVVVGTTMLLIAVTAISLGVARRPDRRTILVGAAVMALAFFVLPTRVHERYLFPFFAMAVVLAAVSVRWRVAYLVLAGATFANMYVVLTTIYPGNPSIDDWLGIGPQLRSWHGVAIAAAIHLAGFAWAAVQLRSSALERLAAEIGRSRRDPAPRADETRTTESATPGGWPMSPAGGTVAFRPVAPSPEPVHEPPAWFERPTVAEAGLTGWLRARLFDRPIRPDRTSVLRAERGGRLDRLDLWILIVLVVAGLVLRVWRLAEPYRMHFDEVYHARTATEFLQFWRYGLDQYIYEWTHPHLAKYAIAGGIVAFADDRVEATSELGVPVRAVALEPRWADGLDPGGRSGDRLYVATGSEVRAYDLRSRGMVWSAPLAGASAVAVDRAGHVLYVGADDGSILTVDLRGLDALRDGDPADRTPPPGPLALTTLARPIAGLFAPADGSGLFARLDDDTVVTIDPETSEELARIHLDDVAGFADAGSAPAVVAVPGEVTDRGEEAATLAEILGGDEAAYEASLGSTVARAVVAGVDATGDVRTALDEAIASGRLPGITVDTVTRVAVAQGDGLTMLSPLGGPSLQEVGIEGGAQGVALVEVDDPVLYVTNDHPDGPRFVLVKVGGDSATGKALLGANHPLPGRGSWVGFDEASDQVHVLAEPPPGRPADQAATIYVIEPHAEAVYADAALPFRPAAVALDVAGDFPSTDRQDILAIDGGGTVAEVDIGMHAFGWRLPGVLAGVAMAALIYLLSRILFRRRSVAVIAGVLTLLDGMLFVQSRIAMNDAYVALFIVAAYALFAAIWTGAWRWRGAFWLAMPAIGLLLGLALSAKWVAAYAIGALGILILARSALGRVVLLAGMIVATTILGYLAVSVPEGQSGGNLTFMLIMIGLTLAAVIVAVIHPIAWSTDEVRFAIGAPAAAGGVVVLVALALGRVDAEISLGPARLTALEAGFGLALTSLIVAGLLWLAGRSGFGPLAPPPAPDDPARLLEPPAPAAEGWLRPGWLGGVPVAWILACLLAIPIAVYVVSYIPWAQMQNHVIVDTAPRVVDGVEVSGWPWPKEGDTQTLAELTRSMYDYHNNLSDAHAASSPWWAWPFDLKPVWFYQEFFAGGTAAAIYDAGTLAIWWLGVPAMAFAAWQAFKRRNLGLALIAIGFACQWIAWARIDRAAFQYHYYTSLPFVVLGLAYFIAEIWHGASARTWLLARLAAGAAILGPALLWLFHRPLCGFVNVEAVNPGSQACPTLIPELALTQKTAALAVVVGVAVFVLVRQFLRLERARPGEPAAASARHLLPIAVTSLVALVALGVVTRLGEVDLIVLRNIAVEPIAMIVLLPLLALAAVVATARDARRFVIGLLAVIAATFVVLYPNISGLPLPSAVFNAYQGLLPTYLYPFQFPVSTVDRSGPGPELFGLGPLVLLLALVATSLIVAYSAWVWRVALAERRLEPADEEGEPAYVGSGGS